LFNDFNDAKLLDDLKVFMIPNILFMI